MRIPDSILRDPDSVIILPIFFFNPYYISPDSCRTINHCTNRYLKAWRVSSRCRRRMPSTKDELISCVLKWRCRRTKKGLYTHDYICADWFVLNGTVAKLNCLRSIGQEPYVLLRHSPATPLYNPLLFNYGYNKQVLIEELRFKCLSWKVGWRVASKWYILLNTFAMDIVHPSYKCWLIVNGSSKIKKDYLMMKRSMKSETREIVRRALLDIEKRYRTASLSRCYRKPYLGSVF